MPPAEGYSSSEEPILWLWALSAWAAKVVAYLALRKIPHSRCEQPITQPRPDLSALGVQYRRIPLMSVGRDMYCDTLLILEKLEDMYPESSGYKMISAKNPTEKALEKLFEKWTDAVVFKSAAAVIKSSLDLMKDPNFQADREELWGRKWTPEAQDALRPDGLANMKAFFEFLEEILGDGRDWILEGDGPTLTDIHACWIFDWLMLLDSFDDDFFSNKAFPKALAYRERYKSAIEKAREAETTPPELEGKDAIAKILKSGFNESNPKVEADPLGLKEGELVDMHPIDTGYNQRDSGKLVLLNSKEVAVSTLTQQGGEEIRIHYPRWNFSITRQKKATADSAQLGSDHVG